MSENHVVEVLIVEDNPQDLELTKRALRKAKLTNKIQVARDGAKAITTSSFAAARSPSGRSITVRRLFYSTSNFRKWTAWKC